MSEITFLDLVRRLGAADRDACHPDCDLSMHREEAARFLGLLLQDPEACAYLAKRTGARFWVVAPEDGWDDLSW